MVSLDLWNRFNKAIDIDFGFSVNDGNGKQVAYKRSATPCNFAPMGGGDDYWGFDFVKLSDLMSSLVNGTLIIEVHMRLANHTKPDPPIFIPENPSACKMIQGLFMNDKSANIVFEVGGNKGKDNATKVAKTAPVTFPAHRLIVENCSSIFADLCESQDDSAITPIIQINDW